MAAVHARKRDRPRVKPTGVELRRHADCRGDVPVADAATAADRLSEMIVSGWITQALCVGAELRIPDLLAAGYSRIDELARASDCDGGSLHRLMRALASLGVCAEDSTGAFQPTELGSLLRSDASQGLRSWAIWWGRHQWPVWEHLDHSVRSGESARRLMYGADADGYSSRDPEAAAIFNQAMIELTRSVARELLEVVDFSNAVRLVDIGGGCGELLATILVACPGMQGVLFERAQVMAGAAAHLEAASVEQRCTLVAGDFFETVPDGGDVYLLKSVLHGWDDALCSVLLRNCRRAMSTHARLVLVERLMPPIMSGSAPDRAAARTDLNMLVGSGGRERTLAELEKLLVDSGLEPERVTGTRLAFFVVECARA